MFSTPVDLGHQTADADGRVVFRWTIDLDTAPGTHEFQASGPWSGDAAATFSVAAVLAATGAPPLWPAAAGGSLALAIGAVLTARRSIRRAP